MQRAAQRGHNRLRLDAGSQFVGQPAHLRLLRVVENKLRRRLIAQVRVAHVRADADDLIPVHCRAVPVRVARIRAEALAARVLTWETALRHRLLITATFCEVAVSCGPKPRPGHNGNLERIEEAATAQVVSLFLILVLVVGLAFG